MKECSMEGMKKSRIQEVMNVGRIECKKEGEKEGWQGLRTKFRKRQDKLHIMIDMLFFKAPIKRPVLNTRDKQLKKEAIDVFKCILYICIAVNK